MNAFFTRHLRFWINLWPPFLGAGIRVRRMDRNWEQIAVEMKLRFYNSNYVGTHYGGSLYSMADPFFMVMLMNRLGRDYIVWDKAATIRFKRPGRGTVTALFRIAEDQLAEIRNALTSDEKIERTFSVNITDKAGGIVAEVDKLIYIRRKP